MGHVCGLVVHTCVASKALLDTFNVNDVPYTGGPCILGNGVRCVRTLWNDDRSD